MSKLLNFENVIKLCGGIIAVCSLYYAIDKRLSLIEQKMDYMVEAYKDKEIEAKLQLGELKSRDEVYAKEIAYLREKMIRLMAVMPKRIQIENEKD